MFGGGHSRGRARPSKETAMKLWIPGGVVGLIIIVALIAILV
ncbi:hypothetical protein FM105_10410 [Brevibacterium yomogidense]|uniref:Uncharacterized protein n=1 Tax=Brevibacterium yomogidense TaxID=946573 RepID=A0A1X6XJ84_9MICO|nr:hypothetical protein FM105_10410 [Brevibacterium yomogidense]